MASQKQDEDRLFQFDTVPPPDGEQDPYNAPTKIGPITADALMALVEAGVKPEGAGHKTPVAPPPPRTPAVPPAEDHGAGPLHLAIPRDVPMRTPLAPDLHLDAGVPKFRRFLVPLVVLIAAVLLVIAGLVVLR